MPPLRWSKCFSPREQFKRQILLSNDTLTHLPTRVWKTEKETLNLHYLYIHWLNMASNEINQSTAIQYDTNQDAAESERNLPRQSRRISQCYSVKHSAAHFCGFQDPHMLSHSGAPGCAPGAAGRPGSRGGPIIPWGAPIGGCSFGFPLYPSILSTKRASSPYREPALHAKIREVKKQTLFNRGSNGALNSSGEFLLRPSSDLLL